MTNKAVIENTEAHVRTATKMKQLSILVRDEQKEKDPFDIRMALREQDVTGCEKELAYWLFVARKMHLGECECGPDGRMCESCKAMAGDEIPLGFEL